MEAAMSREARNANPHSKECLMIHLNYLAVVTAAVAVFLFAAVYYTVVGAQLTELRGATAASPPPIALVMGSELFKGLSSPRSLRAWCGLPGLPRWGAP
jgi:hypothetical protein